MHLLCEREKKTCNVDESSGTKRTTSTVHCRRVVTDDVDGVLRFSYVSLQDCSGRHDTVDDDNDVDDVNDVVSPKMATATRSSEFLEKMTTATRSSEFLGKNDDSNEVVRVPRT